MLLKHPKMFCSYRALTKKHTRKQLCISASNYREAQTAVYVPSWVCDHAAQRYDSISPNCQWTA